MDNIINFLFINFEWACNGVSRQLRNRTYNYYYYYYYYYIIIIIIIIIIIVIIIIKQKFAARQLGI